eukprot:6312245-Amphidinium_carterae.2
MCGGLASARDIVCHKGECKGKPLGAVDTEQGSKPCLAGCFDLGSLGGSARADSDGWVRLNCVCGCGCTVLEREGHNSCTYRTANGEVLPSSRGSQAATGLSTLTHSRRGASGSPFERKT